MSSEKRRLSAPIGILGALALAVGCAGPATSPPDVVVITLDTLRADHVGVYGGRASTPTLDGLAAKGLIFERAVTQLPETRPAHASLMTSRYPNHHGVVSNSHTLAEEAVSLAEVYRDAGYRTGAFVGCALFTSDSGLQQGFDHFEESPTPQRPAEVVVESARDWLYATGNDQPIFMWLHLFDPHMPYEAPDPPPSASGEAELAKFTWPLLMAAAAANGGDVPEPMLRRALTLYRHEVEHMDRQLERVLSDLEARPGWRSTIVVAAADHGECFGGGVWFDHSYCLGEGAIAVPLILRAEAIDAGKRSQAVVELVDVAPTLLRLSGLDVPPEFTGAGLLAKTAGAAADAFFQHPFYRTDALAGRLKIFETLQSVGGEAVLPVDGERLQTGIRRENHKLVDDGGRPVLYDLVTDPDESSDIAEIHPDLVLELSEALQTWFATTPMSVNDAETINPELRRQLEALGYL